MLRTLFLLALVALSQADTSSSEEQDDAESILNLGFYITSQCMDTKNFVTRQLYPTYSELSQYLNVEFIPWGKSRRNPDGSITCQFGPTDCQANKIQSCVLKQLANDQAKQVEYINCEMVNWHAVQLNYTCAIEVGVSEATAKACYESSEGDTLQAEAEAKTGEITMIFVPTIVKDGRYNVTVQNLAYRDFKGYVCDLLQSENPVACQ